MNKKDTIDAGDIMKKPTLTILTILVLTLSACGASDTPQSASGQPNASADLELPLTSKLVIGSFNLEDTDLAITSEQAIELLPLWSVYKVMSVSDTAAQEEIDALVEQIQESMTPEQMTAINEMNLTQQDVFTVMQEQGVQFGSGIQGNNDSNNGGGFPDGPGFPGGGPSGGAPIGSPPGGGFGNGQGQGLSPEQIATAQALRAEDEGGFRFAGVPTPLVEALIQLLRKKAGL
jgi:hypothetical protein